ncbi:biotin--[acetyl-CoA-carboxylase] ligase [Anaerosporobacter faecicola]|uniref:biotin--[acetyl-CoA-carboxylase] ligase n=1 Tax=Anaerosporobacter faecicola TaxID=2718714 RepID=UPI001439A035|nr:biotin--[acetyl-CoA-carboxylase] ligase [Anaerosporobacter faecicola]
MKTEILTILSKQDGYVSGQDLCEQLGVSRTAIWKVMKRLKEEGYEIDSISNKGYRLLHEPDCVTKEAILSRLQTNYMGKNVFSYEEVTSTNTIAKQLAEEGQPEGSLVVAEKQTQGKGRRGRSWVAKKGSGVFMTIVLKPQIAPTNAAMITIVTALALNDAIKELTELDSKIKWPNDIVLGKKKVAGILTELSAEVDYINYVVVGIGVNVNTEEFPEELADKATSIFLEAGKNVNRAKLIARTMFYLETYYEQFLKTQDLSLLQEAYTKVLINMDQEVQILGSEDSFTGVARGITKAGHLLVEKPNKEIVEVYAGEVSVRGLYSYT